MLTSKDFGLKESEVAAFGDPVHQGGRNGVRRVDRGRPPVGGLKRQWDLQRDAVKLMRDFGMTPVLRVQRTSRRRSRAGFEEAPPRGELAHGRDHRRRDHRERKRPAPTRRGERTPRRGTGTRGTRASSSRQQWSEHEVSVITTRRSITTRRRRKRRRWRRWRGPRCLTPVINEEEKDEKKEEESHSDLALRESSVKKKKEKDAELGKYAKKDTSSGPFTSSTRATRCCSPAPPSPSSLSRTWHRSTSTWRTLSG